MLCPEIAMEEISPVDLTAEAIIRLFDKKVSENQTFHVFNPKLYNIQDILCAKNGFKVKNTTVDNFFKNIINRFNNIDSKREIERYLLHMGWLNDLSDNKSQTKVMQSKTEYILRKLGFIWPSIQNEAISNYISREMNHGKET
jgi:surfactin family lipopeptide synthetase A